eukprot:11288849-Ditylum_brightwellii.AAC.1
MPGGLKAPEEFHPFQSSCGLSCEDPAPDKSQISPLLETFYGCLSSTMGHSATSLGESVNIPELV